jgi:DNA phosphorothioation system restriction enzyme
MQETKQSLAELGLKDKYRSGDDDLVKDFYIPCLTVSSSYDRAVGYFTSTALALATQGLKPFINRGGLIRVIASPRLNEDDARDIEAGYEEREIIERALLRGINELVATERYSRQLGLVGRLIADGQLEMKIAFMKRLGGVGMYHEKIAIFRDDFSEVVATCGSNNESYNALESNFESLQSFRSWKSEDVARLEGIISDFERLWEDQTSSLNVIAFPSVAVERLITIGKFSRLVDADLDFTAEPLDEASESVEKSPSTDQMRSNPQIPDDIDIRGYQNEAINKWFASNGRGLWKMATGTGKTITALAAITKLQEFLTKSNTNLLVLILCPYTHLVDQWAEEARHFGMRPLLCLGSRSDWMPTLEAALAGSNVGSLPFLPVIATNKTFSGDAFQELFRKRSAAMLLIADEVHNLGALGLSKLLPAEADYRLGLSATPERWFDDSGSEALRNYFGETVFELGLKEALEMGALTRYHYYPVLVTLDPDEHEEYVKLSLQIARLVGMGTAEIDGERAEGALKLLLMKRANLLGNASGKIPAFKTEVRRFSDRWFQLVYCSDAGAGQFSGGERQINAVVRVLGQEMGLSVNSYTYQNSRDERRQLLKRFGSGDDLRFLVSMKCLDEGVDIPDARVAYLLASSTNPRQFIQRRGRILRRAEGKTRADIVDFIAVPPESPPTPQTDEIEKRLLRRELSRVIEFANLAENGPEALGTLLELRKRYNLLDI